jgi:U2 small nuclear ribonucleoprotein B''
MKQSLKTLFKEYGNVLDVTAHRSIRMRGQAFVTLDSKDAAAKAVKEVKGFPLYGKPMVSLPGVQEVEGRDRNANDDW